jgi:hypothetical protein
MLRALSIVACFAVIALASCGGSSERGTISGNVTFVGGPVSPTDLHSGTTFHKQSGRVMVLAPGGRTVASQRVQRGQAYRFQVEPSRYRLVLVEQGGRKACPHAVSVRQGETTHANLTCQIP